MQVQAEELIRTAQGLRDRLPGMAQDRGAFARLVLESAGRLIRAKASVLLVVRQDGAVAVADALGDPAPSDSDGWVRQSMQQAAALARDGFGRTARAGDQLGSVVLVPIPGRQRAEGRWVGAWHVSDLDPGALSFSLALASLIAEAGTRLGAMEQIAAARETNRSLTSALEVLTAVNRHGKFREAAMAFCNELADRFGLERASLGVRQGPYIKMRAASGTEHVWRKMDYVQHAEAAMEESADQREEVLAPAPEGVDAVNRAAQDLLRFTKCAGVVSLPLIQEDDATLVLTVETSAEQPLDAQRLASLRLALDLVGPPLHRLWERDRWVGAKLMHQTRRSAAALIGPRHTWLKLIAAGVAAVLLFFIFAKGMYRVEAPFVVEPQVVQVIDVPFEGTLESAYVKPGDYVEAGVTVLAEMRTTPLELQIASLRADRRRYAQEADRAMSERKQAERQISQAKIDQIDAQIARLESDLARATLVSPMSGTVVEGDWSKYEGKSLERGQVLFEVTPLDELRAELMVGEDQINDLAVGQTGSLAAVAAPSRRLPIEVERIAPMARTEAGTHVFPVRVTITDRQDWLRPGMEGVAKIDIERRRYAWIWTRAAVNWLKMQLWL